MEVVFCPLTPLKTGSSKTRGKVVEEVLLYSSNSPSMITFQPNLYKHQLS
jgi:hypothetical protein